MTDTRALVRGLGATAAVLGALAFVVGAPARPRHMGRDTVVSAATRDALGDCDQGVRLLEKRSAGAANFKESDPGCDTRVQPISALQLAQWIRDGRSGLRILDLRDSSAFAARHIPSAESFALIELATVLPKPGETMVLYSDDDVRDAQGIAWLAAVGHVRLHVVQGGMSAWMTEVIDPVVHGDSATFVATLSRYFGGVPRAAVAKDAARNPRAPSQAVVRGAQDEYGFAARRGC